MPITVSCSGCRKQLRAPDTLAGKKVKCPQCGTVIAVTPQPTAGEQGSLLDLLTDAEANAAGLPPAAVSRKIESGTQKVPPKTKTNWGTFIMRADIRDILPLVILSVLAVGIFISYLQFRPDEVADFGTVKGTLLSAKEELSHRNRRDEGYLDIRLQESPLRYRIPMDNYLEHFRREAFFAEVHAGATIQLSAYQTEIDSPRTTLLDSTPTVFVYGVRVGDRDYYRLEDHIAWRAKNNVWKLPLALGCAAGAVFFGVRWYRIQPLQKTSESSKRSEPLSAWAQFKRYAWIGIVVGISGGVRELTKDRNQQPREPQVQVAQPPAMRQQPAGVVQRPVPQNPPAAQALPELGNTPASTSSNPPPGPLVDARARHEKMRQEAQERVEEQGRRLEQLRSAPPPNLASSQPPVPQPTSLSAPEPESPFEPKPAERAARLSAPLGAETAVLGGGMAPTGRDIAPQGGLLVGFKVGLGPAFGTYMVQAIRPIYRVGDKESLGKQCGIAPKNALTAKAKPGYAVGAITVKAGLIANGFSVTFMRIDRDRLDPSDSYESDWLGDDTGGGAPKRLGGDGRWVVGVVARQQGGKCTGIGLLYERPEADSSKQADLPH